MRARTRVCDNAVGCSRRKREDGLIEPNEHVVEARDALFRDYAFDHRMSVT
jgi:hypothetical protein